MTEVRFNTHDDDGDHQTATGRPEFSLPAFLLAVAVGFSLAPGFFLAQWLIQTTPEERRAADAIREKKGALTTRSDLTFQVTGAVFDLAEQSFGDQQFAEVFPHLQAFRDLGTLSLRKTAVTDSAMAYVGQLTNLHSLSLQRTNVTDAGLAQLQGLKELEHLILVQTSISDDGLRYLAELPKLRILLLSKNEIGDAGLAHLSEMTSLRELYIGFSKITDAGLAHLQGLKNLEVLSLQWTNVTDHGLKHIAELKSLKDLSVYESEVTDQGLAELKDTLPDIRILAGRVDG